MFQPPPPTVPSQPKGDRIWLFLSTFTGVAVDVTLNKYSSILPFSAVAALWAIPAVLLVIWVWQVERTNGWVTKHFLEHPVSYVLLFLIFLPFGWQATATLVSKLTSHKEAEMARVLPTAVPPLAGPSPARELPVSPTSVGRAPGSHIAKGVRPLERRNEQPPSPSKSQTVPAQPPTQVPVQSGQDSQQTAVSGSSQSSTGDCSPNVMGNGNTTTAACSPKPIQFSDSQVAIASKALKAHKGLHGQVGIIYEWSAVDGEEAASKLQSILSAAGITATIGSGGMVIDHIGAPSYPGLSFGGVSVDNGSLCDAIEQALKQAGAAKVPLRRLKATSPNQELVIYIRKV